MMLCSPRQVSVDIGISSIEVRDLRFVGDGCNRLSESTHLESGAIVNMQSWFPAKYRAVLLALLAVLGVAALLFKTCREMMRRQEHSALNKFHFKAFCKDYRSFC